MKKFALHVIAKDEVDQCKNIIERYGQYFDEIVIACDEKLDLFYRLANDKVKIFEYKWIDDFADKRNFLAANTQSEYYLRLDTDDEIDHPEKLPAVFSNIVSKDIDVYFTLYDYAKDEHGQTVAQHWRETIIKKRDDLRWNKAIHENIFVDNPEICNLVKDNSFKIIHNIDAEHVISSNNRNIKILLEEFKRDGEKTDPRTLAYLGRFLMGSRKWEDAIKFLHKLVLVSGWDDDKYFAYVQMSQCYNTLGQHDMAIASCNEALAINTTYPDAYLQMGYIYFDKKDYVKACDWIMPGIIRPIPDTVMVVDPSFYGAKAKLIAAFSLLGKGDTKQAIEMFAKAKSEANGNPDILKHESLFTDSYHDTKYLENLSWLCLYTQSKDPTRLKPLIESIPDSIKDERIWSIKKTFTKPKVWKDNEIAIFCGPAWEDWSPVSTITGIGGSEEAVIYLSKELAKLGYEVTVFNGCGDMAGIYDGVKYVDYHAINNNDTFSSLIEWRRYSLPRVKAKRHYVWLHDIPYNNTFTAESVKNITKVIVLSDYHKSIVKNVPDDKFYVSSNGINTSDFEVDGIIRDQYRMIYTSSYDRGIQHLLEVWDDVKAEVPQAELHLFYGWDTYNKMLETGARSRDFKDMMVKLMNKPGIHENGRIGHKQLVKELKRASLWVYPSHFEEISCISAMKAQAAGCIPVCTDYAALKETVKTGIKIKGNAQNDEVKQEFKRVLIEILKDAKRQEEIREQLKDCAHTFSWATVAKQWSSDLLGGVA